ncbi:MAG: tRNA lysidine(34) synthetase TilS [Treponema sp.]|nr:tRNA lysidine(34) synthetase TilS [Treponema sp.]
MRSLEESIFNILSNPAYKIEQNDILLAAVSGGADSTALLAALSALRDKIKFSLYCIHVEHGIRPAAESKGDAEAVNNFCMDRDIPLKIHTIPRGKVTAYASREGTGIEAAARHFRHRAFLLEKRRINAKYILTGHTQDDSIENILMRILKGSGPGGLAGMPQRRGVLLRCMLEITRQDVIAYLKEKNFTYRIDATNSDINFMRNRVRHKLIPLLEESFPSYRKTLLALAETQRLAADFISMEAKSRLSLKKIDKSLLSLNEKDFLDAPLILREEAVYDAISILSPKKNIQVRRAALRNIAMQAIGADLKADLGAIRMERRNGEILLRSSKTEKDRGFSLLIKREGLYTLNKGLCINVSEGAPFPMVFRSHRVGDRLFRGRHKRRFSDIINRDFIDAITVLDSGGPLAFIGISLNGDIMIESREGYGADAFKVSRRG